MPNCPPILLILLRLYLSLTLIETPVYQSTLVVSYWWVGLLSSKHPEYVPAWAPVPFLLEMWCVSLNRPKRSSLQRPRATQRLLELQLVCLYQSGLSVQGIKIFSGTRHPVTKGPLPKVGRKCSNFANIFPYFFGLQPLSHLEMLHPQYQNNCHT